MKNKILGSIVLVIAVLGIIFGIVLIPQVGSYGWQLLGGSIVLVLVGVVVYRRGIQGALRSVHDGTPKELR